MNKDEMIYSRLNQDRKNQSPNLLSNENSSGHGTNGDQTIQTISHP